MKLLHHSYSTNEVSPSALRIRTVLLAALIATGMGMHARADIVYDCFKVVSYSVNWHIECTLDGFANAVDISIDDNVQNGWRAGDHGCRGYACLAPAVSNETVDAGTFIAMESQVEYPNQSDFIIAFAIGCSSSKSIDGNFGWVRVAYDRTKGQIIIKDGALNTTRGESIVAGIEEFGSDLDWQTVDCGDHLELVRCAIPSDTEGRVVIPREIGGKPVTSIGAGAFYECSGLTSLIIPNSISNINTEAFAHCARLTSISIPASVTNLCAGAFDGCSRLQALSLHGPALVIAGTVRNLPALRSLEFGTGVRTISGGAVSNCQNLITVTIPVDVERVEALAFADCPALASVAVHYITEADAHAFPDGCEVTRFGIDLPMRFYNEPPVTDAEFLQFVKIVGREPLVGKTKVSWTTDPYGDSSLRGLDRASVWLGLHPVRYDWYSGIRRAFYFGKPTITVTDFNPRSRTVKLKVSPAEGSHVAAMPMLEYVHLMAIYDLGTANQREEELDLGSIEGGFADYITSNGEFTIVFPPTDARFFYLRVGTPGERREGRTSLVE